jgi:hypothetical protein
MSKKRRFQQFTSQNVRETTPFLPFLYISGSLEGLFDFYDPLHHHHWTRRSLRPANSRRTKQF